MFKVCSNNIEELTKNMQTSFLCDGAGIASADSFAYVPAVSEINVCDPLPAAQWSVC